MPKDSLYLLDRYFPTVPALRELASQNAANARKVDLIARMRLSAVAYREASATRPGQRGRKPRKGEKIRLADLFETERASFQTKKIWLYGKKQLIHYYFVDLLWGQGLYRKLRFVLVEYDGKRVLFISTNLSIPPSSIIRFYGYRFRIEGTFRTFKLDLGGMAYHFWTKAAPRLNHFRKKDAPDPLSAVASARERGRILKTVRATDMYALLCSISINFSLPDSAKTA